MKWILYRWIMRVAHRYNWHYAPPVYPDRDTMLWCKWCGLRYVSHRARKGIIGVEKSTQEAGPAKGGHVGEDARPVAR